MNQNPRWQKYSSLEDYWKSSTLHELRKNLLSGIPDPSCKKCWDMEQAGLQSMRQSVSINRPLTPQLVTNPRIRQVKLQTGNRCNLACMMCFDTVSTTYKELWKSNAEWLMPLNKQTRLVYNHEMDTYIRTNAFELEYIEVLGGEPLFEKRLLALMEYLIDIGANRNLVIFVITNGTLFTPKIKHIFQQFKKTIFCVSVDGIGLANEYQRWPSEWATVEKNLEMINSDFDMSILPTVTALNIMRLPELIDFCQQKNYVLNNLNLVDHWPQLSPSNLPDRLRSAVSKEFQPWLAGTQDTHALVSFIRQWDNQRGIKISDYMSEWADIV